MIRLKKPPGVRRRRKAKGLLSVNQELVLYVRHKCNVTCSLDRYSERSLMLCTVACDSSRKDLTSLRDVSLELVYILLIDLVVLFTTENANFFSSAHAASSLHRSIASILIECHYYSSFSVPVNCKPVFSSTHYFRTHPKREIRS